MENAINLCEESTRPMLGCGEGDESCFNWVDKPLTIKEAQGIATLISNKIETLTASMISQQLRISPVATITQRLCLALCNLFLGKLTEVGNHVKKAAQLIEEASEKYLVSKDYADGLRYLLNDLNASRTMAIKLADSIIQDEENKCSLALGQMTSFGDLPPLARAVITGVHAFVAGHRNQSEKEIQLFRRVTKADPENIEWTVGLHRALRTARRDQVWRGVPSAEEKEAVVRAFRLNKDHLHVKLHVCIYLKDVIDLERVPKGSLDLGGDFQIHSLVEAIDRLKILCNEIIQSEDTENSLMANLILAGIIGFSLSRNFDCNLWKKCVDNALKLNPKSSKANHLRGRLVLHTSKDHDEALVHMKRAFDNNHSNSSALMDIIHLLLQKPQENSEELEAIFEEYVVQNGNQWPTFREASLVFRKGLYHYMINEKEEAIRIWIEAYKIDPGCLSSFKGLWRLCGLFEWDRKLVLVTDMTDYMNHMLVSEEGSLPTEESEIICKFVEAGELQREREIKKKEKNKRKRRNRRIRQRANQPRIEHYGDDDQPTQDPKGAIEN